MVILNGIGNAGENNKKERFEVILDEIRVAARQQVLWTAHAIEQMAAPDRMVLRSEVMRVIWEGEVIEERPDDPRGHNCLLLGYGDGRRPIHVVCSPKNDYLAVITAYLPNPSLWSPDLKRRL
ncbi:MAG: DUF4258 domain-containing protein [Cyanobacteria bacterium NC_groundwater_1444_Ag_S-0.65um_54_12]|nr:DUF4258 domain-containing protein [Cyanobacteria bacterium NC_groundwater_1444_Ag_S-0.65um_54_12]